MNNKKQSRGTFLQIIFITALILFIFLAFLIFVRSNNRRIVEQNNSFIEAAARQTAERIDDLIDLSEQTAGTIAHLYESTLKTPVVNEEILSDMTEHSTFDYVEFISPNGMDLTADGKTADLSDTEYFKLGIKGQSGKCVVKNSKITNETLIVFYSPFYYDNEIIGVLCCILKGGTFEEKLTSDYFGIQGSTYLLERNGDVIVCTGVSDKPKNLIDKLREKGLLSPQNLENLETALNPTNDVDFNSFNYKGEDVEGSAYVKVLKNKEWVIVQSLPSAVTGEMTKSANHAGIRLEIMLVTAFAIYIVCLLVRNRLQRKELANEKQVMTDIVEATKRLFIRFALVDFETDSYEYLENKKSGAPEKGNYSELRRYLEKRYVTENDGDTTDMKKIISPEYAKENLTDNVPYLQFEYEINLDGRRWENMSIICITRKKGKPSTVLYAIQDVTTLKEREQEIRLALKNSTEAAEAANRAKSDFLARMSHDIRTPLNAIMGMTAVAAMHIDDREKVSDCLSKITISSRHLLALINDVLDMSKIESGKVSLSEEPFSIADMVDGVVTIIKNQVKAKNQKLKVHINSITHEDVIGDHLRLRQVFVNILGNAVKFTPEGGTITFTIREVTTRIHGMVCFEFICEDTGMGMEPEFLKTIFDPFSRGKNAQSIEGTGLGMPITRNIIRMMSGDISVESKVGVGSKFTVQIHLKPCEPGDDAAELADLKVLVADDDRDSCIATCDILKAIGMNSDWVLSGDEAVSKILDAHSRGEDYAAVILDWKMPDKDGVETAREIREKVEQDVPIIILSAYDWTDIEAQAREAGIQAFIEKPLFRSRLVYALKSVLAKDSAEKRIADTLEDIDLENKRVLLVEDNELNLEIAEELLSYTGVKVEHAVNGQEALDAFKSSELGYFDLIFMDIQMPVMNGYDASRAIRALEREDAKTVPIIAMTANAFSDDIFKAHEAGMNDHISKPIDVAKLAEALNKYID